VKKIADDLGAGLRRVAMWVAGAKADLHADYGMRQRRTDIFSIADGPRTNQVLRERAFAQSVLATQFRLVIDLADFCDPRGPLGIVAAGAADGKPE